MNNNNLIKYETFVILVECRQMSENDCRNTI